MPDPAFDYVFRSGPLPCWLGAEIGVNTRTESVLLLVRFSSRCDDDTYSSTQAGFQNRGEAGPRTLDAPVRGLARSGPEPERPSPLFTSVLLVVSRVFS